MIGNHVYGNHRTRGSNPLLSANNYERHNVRCVFLLFLELARIAFFALFDIMYLLSLKGDVMNNPYVLLYNLQNLKGAKIKMICHKLSIGFKSVNKSEYSLKISELLSNKEAENLLENGDFSDEMLLLAHFNNQLLNKFLKNLKAEKVPVALKAVLTKYNCEFTSIQLYNEISAEHKALREGRVAHKD